MRLYWVLFILGIIIWIIPIKESEREWGSNPRYIKPTKQVKKKLRVNMKAKLKRKLKSISNFLFTDDIKK